MSEPDYTLPPYKGVQAELRQRIRDGRWSRGHMIPSRRALAREFRISVPTIQRAIADLVAEGALRVEATRGTFVPEGDDLNSVAIPQIDLNDAPRGQRAIAEIGIVGNLRPSRDGHVSNDWHIAIVEEAEHTITGLAGRSRFFDWNRLSEREPDASKLVEQIVGDCVAGLLVVMPGDNDGTRAIFRVAQAHRVPIVAVTVDPVFPQCCSVGVDHGQAGYVAANHLILSGCRSLTFFAPLNADWAAGRLAGVREAVRYAALPDIRLVEFIGETSLHDPASVIARSSQQRLAREAAETLLRHGLPTEGIVAANDMAAGGFVEAASERGWTLGRDYALVGFDDGKLAREFGFSSVRPPLAALGSTAAKLLDALIRDESIPVAVKLGSRLVARSAVPVFPRKG